MSADNNNHADETNADWASETLAKALEEMMSAGVISSKLIEARPIWSVPGQVMIGQLREAGEESTFRWLVSGDVPTDQIHSTIAATPREAARHFSLKWQMDAARYENEEKRMEITPDERARLSQLARLLVERAEWLYDVVEDDRFWQTTA